MCKLHCVIGKLSCSLWLDGFDVSLRWQDWWHITHSELMKMPDVCAWLDCGVDCYGCAWMARSTLRNYRTGSGVVWNGQRPKELSQWVRNGLEWTAFENIFGWTRTSRMIFGRIFIQWDTHAVDHVFLPGHALGILFDQCEKNFAHSLSRPTLREGDIVWPMQAFANELRHGRHGIHKGALWKEVPKPSSFFHESWPAWRQ